MNESRDLLKEGFVSFFFLGRAPLAPGTFGTLGALTLAYLVSENIDGLAGGGLLLGIGATVYYLGVHIAPWCEEKYGKDPGIYVIDEVIGYLITISFIISKCLNFFFVFLIFIFTNFFIFQKGF